MVVANFPKGPSDLNLFAKDVLKIAEKNNGELTHLAIENFETLCDGKTELGEMLIERYVRKKKLKQITSISKDEEGHFQEFLDAVIDTWQTS